MAWDCSHDKAYISIMITVPPMWCVITVLIVFVLIAFHKCLRATKIYDNCTKETANHVYYIEIRTGDTSATYNRRKTTITIDMFDEIQTTLARIAIPGHVIFGGKDSPVDTVDDDRFFELRVTRLWLYRSNRLRRVATIRITHTCLENEARIMIYGVEIRSSEPEQPKIFFPVMNYVTAYGTVNKPNACFDSEPLGSISGMGGHVEQSFISDQLSYIDYTLLVLLLMALIFQFSTHNFLENSFANSTQASYKGAIIGFCCFSVTLIVGIAMRYVVKHNYSLRIGTGLWAIVYYFFCALIFIPSTGLWIYTAYYGYKILCTNDYSMWLLSICVAIVEAVALTFIFSASIWLTQSCSPIYTEQYVLPDDVSLVPNDAAPNSASKNRGSHQSRSNRQSHPPPHSWQITSTSSPPQLASSPSSVPLQYLTQPPQTYAQPNVYPSPTYMVGPQGFKTYHQPAAGFSGNYEHQQAQPQQPPYYSIPTLHSPPPAHLATRSGQSPAGLPASPINYHQQTNAKVGKKLGSNESTGSTYFQQLMKNKGGVKSISQYGELIKQNKATKK